MNVLIYRIWEDVDDIFKVSRSCELVDDDIEEVFKTLQKEEQQFMRDGLFFEWMIMKEDAEGNSCVGYQSAGWNDTIEESEMDLCEANFVDSTK